MQKIGWFGQLGATQGHLQFNRAYTTSYSTLIETMRLSCIVVEI